MQTIELTSPNQGFPLLTIDGDPDGIQCQSGIIASTEAWGGLLHECLNTLTSEFEQMQGESVTAAIEMAADMRQRLIPVRATLTDLARVIATYADALDEAKTSIDPLVQQVKDAHNELTAAKAVQAATAELVDAFSGTPESVVLESAMLENADAIAAVNHAQARLDDLWDRYEAYFSTWRDAYERAIDGVAISLPPGEFGDDRNAGSSGIEQLMTNLVSSDPAAVLDGWQRLSADQQAAIVAAYPNVIGNLEGVPYEVRAEVNYEVLVEASQGYHGEPLDTEIQLLLDEVERNGGSLISLRLDAANQATAALLYGDLSAATDVNVLVPGMNTSISGLTGDEIQDWGQSARDLNDAVESANPDADSATVVWFGYDTPNIPEEPFMGHADEGAAQLTSFLGGLALEQPPTADLAVIAHSYGSTTAGEAIGSAIDNLGVDQFITLGSAGLPGTYGVRGLGPETDLNFESAEIFATVSEYDPWSPFGQATSFGHNIDPRDMPDAVEFDSDGGYAEQIVDGEGTGMADRNQPLQWTPGHSTHDFSIASDFRGLEAVWLNQIFNPDNTGAGYLQDGSESLYNIAEIVATGEPWSTPDQQPEIAP